MRQKRAFYVMLAVLGATVLAGCAGFYFGSRMLRNRASTIADLKADQQIVDQQVDVYEETKHKVGQLGFVDTLAAEVLPAEKAQASAVGQLKLFATESGTAIQNLSFTGSTDTKNPALSQTSAVEGLTGVRSFQISLTLRSGVEYKQFILFLKRIETNRRRMQVTSLNITPDALNRNKLSSATLAIDIYLRG